MSLLDLIASVIPVADVPEFIIQLYLPGDECLDNYTLKKVFTTPYNKIVTRFFTETRFFMETYTYLDKNCTVLHSFDDNPSCKSRNKSEWYRNGKLHRENDLPARLITDDNEQPTLEAYFYNGKFHRENDEPAYIVTNCYKIWYNHGDIQHILWNDGAEKWFKNGLLHREGGLPALIHADGTNEYFEYGRKLLFVGSNQEDHGKRRKY